MQCYPCDRNETKKKYYDYWLSFILQFIHRKPNPLTWQRYKQCDLVTTTEIQSSLFPVQQEVGMYKLKLMNVNTETWFHPTWQSTVKSIGSFSKGFLLWVWFSVFPVILYSLIHYIHLLCEMTAFVTNMLWLFQSAA